MHSNFANVFRETKNAVLERIALRSISHRSPFILRSSSVCPPFEVRSGSRKQQKDKRRMREQKSTEQGRTINFLSTFKFSKQWQD